jgi:hypothetical protein
MIPLLGYLLIALALFWAFKFLQHWIEAPDWLWLLFVARAAAMSLAPWDQTGYGGSPLRHRRHCGWDSSWWRTPLIVKADEALTVVMRATARRPR